MPESLSNKVAGLPSLSLYETCFHSLVTWDFFARRKIHKFSNPIQDGPFRGCSRMGWGAKRPPIPKICYTYPTIMKLSILLPQLKNTSKKDVNQVTRPLSSANISIFSPRIGKFWFIKKYRYRLHFKT